MKECEQLTVTLFLCPLPSQKEYVTSISSFLISSWFLSHSCLSRSLSFLSASSRSLSGRKEVSTLGFLRNLPRLEGGPSSFRSSLSFEEDRLLLSISAESSPSPSSSIANDSVALAAFFLFFTFFVSSLNKFSTIYKPSNLPVRASICQKQMAEE